ncbi:HAD-IB family hydrolase [Gryllotalpicola daejeonensis]|uniref:HAD-IB family hydrolase n=1 Tax=Gryllotalpicola daejeonensis TaxID=993087 RepID=A0ABP7ZKQ2_9MICO
MTSAGAAFFDVDETLVSVRTLESFLMFYLKRVPSMISPERLRELAGQVVTLERSEFNRRYYAIWAGQPVEQVLEAGREWFAGAQQQTGFYRPNVLAALREHQQNGTRVVLVSGSFPPPLAPIAEAVGADALYCTELEVGADGAYTGVISAAMIGDDKRVVVDRYLAEIGEDAPSWGYGDHSSDLPLLEGVANPVVVGSDPAMLEFAAARDWPVLPIEQPLAPRA